MDAISLQRLTFENANQHIGSQIMFKHFEKWCITTIVSISGRSGVNVTDFPNLKNNLQFGRKIYVLSGM
jgi:ribosomal protein L35AE/L33A